MRTLQLLAAAGLFAGSTTPFLGAELADIPRTIAREPQYSSPAAKYCLLVFGPDAKTRVWIVQDGDVLYVDRNGNGDLTEPQERIAASDKSNAEGGEFVFEAGDIRDAGRLHKDLKVYTMKLAHLVERDEDVRAALAEDPHTRFMLVAADVEMTGWRGVGLGGRVEQAVSFSDSNGVLKFAARPADAPIIHFGGRWEITLFGRQRLTIGRQADLVLGLATPGLGPGTTAYFGYEQLVPASALPQVEVSYPAAREGEAPFRELYEIKGRC